MPAFAFPHMPEPPPLLPWARGESSERHTSASVLPAKQKLISHIVTHRSSPMTNAVTRSTAQTVMPTQTALTNRDSMIMGLIPRG